MLAQGGMITRSRMLTSLFLFYCLLTFTAALQAPESIIHPDTEQSLVTLNLTPENPCRQITAEITVVHFHDNGKPLVNRQPLTQ